MNALHLARSAYGRPETPVKSNRQIEYDLFARITRQLADGQRRRDSDFASFARAVHDNIRLWTTLAADVALPGNGLPAPLRAQLFYLYEFTATHSRKVLRDGASIEVLIDINTAIMRGLRGEGEAR